MSDGVQQLVAEVAQVTGAAMPEVLAAESPAFRADTARRDDIYLIGLIGGKDVGKSALVNALVGQPITDSTAFGPGTETVIAYAHQSRTQAVRELLDREAPGRFQIVTHSIASLERQVLLDLPDIDSIYDDHVALTRKMLRHMLFPIWVQSVEKYADQQPQKLLAAVAEGNDPANFVFCLNKADQLEPGTIEELRSDYAQRIAKVLRRSPSAKVFMVSAIRPDRFDLPALRDLLSQQKSAGAVKKSIELAGRQRDRSMLAWLDAQRLPERVARLKRLEREAEELVASRLTTPLLDDAVPAILDDPTHRAAMVDEGMTARVSRWPVVNLVHTLLWPLTTIWRQNVGTAATPDGLVGSQTDSLDGRSLSAQVQATFALLHQTHPATAPLYRQQKLWEQLHADGAAADLRRAMTTALQGQRAEAMDRLARRGILMPIIRWTLTIGAILWFPLVQPVLEVFLKGGLVQTSTGIALLIVQLLSAAYLLKSAGFLAIYFLVLWLMLRWNTQRRVSRLLSRWRQADGSDATVNLATAVMAWCDELLDPIRVARQREEQLAQKADEAKQKLTADSAAA
jgi:GTPase Era involved in 16S rRNA processing